jgi:hypothetical protein
MTIVTAPYRYKRPLRKRAMAVAIAAPAIVRAGSKPDKAVPRVIAANQAEAAAPPANDDRKSAIVTIRSRKRAALADVPDLSLEELQRRATGKERS